jgi:pimeloyl-ACP methyl ester carboxylesterase
LPRPLALLAAVAAALLVLAAPAAADTRVTLQGAPGGGPKSLDKVFVHKTGPSKAKNVLVLIPGTIGGAGGLTEVARDIVKRVPNLQVWSIDRRWNALEDPSMLRRGARGEVTPKQVFDYYIGWIADSSIRPRYQPLDASKYEFAHDWGLELMLEDVRRVVRSARRGGRRVLLGGHSLGASATVAYAAWDFRGQPGHRDLAGMVLIDGGLNGTFRSIDSVEAARQRLEDARRTSPFTDLLGLGLPWAAGAFAEVGGLAAWKAPTERSTAQDFPLLPEMFKPPVPATNRALFGYALDESTSPDALSLIHMRMGRLADEGDPRDWRSGEVTPVGRAARIFAAQDPGFVEWYYPKRLNIDVDGASSLQRNAVTNAMGLRVWRGAEIDLPLYAFQTDLTRGRVLQGARNLIGMSKIPRARATLVDRGRTTSHLDPLTAAPATNDFLKTVVPFLRREVRRAGRPAQRRAGLTG